MKQSRSNSLSFRNGNSPHVLIIPQLVTRTPGIVGRLSRTFSPLHIVLDSPSGKAYAPQSVPSRIKEVAYVCRQSD